MNYQPVITPYNSDSGTRDLSSEKKYSKDVSYEEIKKIAIELGAHLIVLTSYTSEAKPGAWYIKGYNKRFSFEEIKHKIEENVKNKKHRKRKCYLIKY
jgi:hypothetical protein